jgi:translation elongation factor EF-G
LKFNHKLSSKKLVKCEPIEELTIDLPENLSGRAVEFIQSVKGEMLSMEGRGTYDYKIPSIIGIIGYVINCYTTLVRLLCHTVSWDTNLLKGNSWKKQWFIDHGKWKSNSLFYR